jgi:hypothetical protein
MPTYEKANDTTLRRITDQPQKVDDFSYDFLLNQKATLEASLAEVNGLLAECDKAGVKKAEDVIKEEPIE